MSAPDSLPPLREVIGRLGLSARKSLGQNFILDLNLTRRIARAAGPLDGVTVIEVGPGPGGLTRALLLENAARVVAIERDARCLPALQEIAARYPGQIRIIMQDALTLDYGALAAEIAGPIRVVSNLPYSIATPLLTGWLSAEPWPPWYEQLTLMFQREVAERIVAQPRSKAYGRLAVLAQWRCEARIVLSLPPRAFTPPPKVSSAVVELRPQRSGVPSCRVATIERLTAAAFGQRRKMLRTSLAALRCDTQQLLKEAGIEPTLRAEDLSVGQFCNLAQVLEAMEASGGPA